VGQPTGGGGAYGSRAAVRSDLVQAARLAREQCAGSQTNSAAPRTYCPSRTRQKCPSRRMRLPRKAIPWPQSWWLSTISSSRCIWRCPTAGCCGSTRAPTFL